jgi:DNA polymerase III epsilon subunit-like protein
MQDLDPEMSRRAAGWLEAGFVVLDFEATGETDQPDVSIVAVGLIDQRGRVLLDTCVQPERSIDPDATAVHGLDNRLAEYLNGKRVAAYSAESEQDVLKAVHERFQLEPIEPEEWYDAAKLYAAFRGSDRFFTLSEACRQMGIPVEHAHQAIDDCRLTLALIHKVAEAGSKV